MRHILITGASSGIGAALATQYATDGMVLGLIGRNLQALHAVQNLCERQGAQVVIGQLDVTCHDQLQAWIVDFDQKYPLDLLIVNAGISHSIETTEQAHSAPNGKNATLPNPPQPQTIEVLKNIHCLIDTNITAAINTIHTVLPAMRARGRGQIALTSSLAAYYGMPVTPAYCASKAAIKAYGEALRAWLAPEGIKVNIICPGFVKSPMSDHFPAPKPFMISAAKAARIIAKGLQRNRAIISFPFPLNWGMRLLSMLPFPLASFFLGLSGYNLPPQVKPAKSNPMSR